MSARPPDILIIEDDEWIAQVLKLALQREGYETARAVDGADALARLAQPPLPRLVTLDVLMPLVTGFTVLAEIRQRELTRTLPVLMLTSVSGKKEVMRAIQDGATDYLTKPFTPADLVTRVRRLLGDGGAPA